MKVAGRKMVLSIVTPGQTGLQFVERLLDPGGDIEGVSPGLLLDDEEDAVAVIDDRVADQGGVADLDLRDIAEADGGTVAELDHGAGEILRRGDEGELVDGKTQVGRVDESARTDDCGIASRFGDCVEGDTGGAKFLGINEHLKLLVALAPDGYVGHARHGHEAGSHRPEGDLAEFHLVQRVRAETDLQDPAQRGIRSH